MKVIMAVYWFLLTGVNAAILCDSPNWGSAAVMLASAYMWERTFHD